MPFEVVAGTETPNSIATGHFTVIRLIMLLLMFPEKVLAFS